MCNCNTPCNCAAEELAYEAPAAAAASGFPVSGTHPIVMLYNAGDIAAFNVSTGLGSGLWDGWALCDGQTQTDSSGASIGTPDMKNRFPVGALDTYATGDTGGSDTHTLTTAEMPVHTHAVTDPGHNHQVTQNAHTHTVTDPGHSHGTTDPGHTHSASSSSENAHTHDVDIPYGTFGTTNAPDTDVYAPSGGSTDTLTTDSQAAHSHTITVASATTGISVSTATTGITLSSETPTITCASETTGITIGNAGSGDAHENRPPYLALVFVMYIG